MRFTRNGVVTALLVIAALFVGSMVTDRLPKADDAQNRPYHLHGAVRDPVEMRKGTLLVTGLRYAKQVQSYSDVAGTQGIWLVVDLEWTPSTQPFILSGADSRVEAASGKQYGGPSPLTTTCTSVQAGITHTCAFAFEMNPAALAGATLLIPASANLKASDDLAVIDLGIDEGRADALAASTESIKLPGGQVKAP